ncbi:MAG: 50S ribosomal protein L3 [Desulfobacterales bacterium]|nr:MAG: 50S ribosomal protein L3 [Desulfobacterales bacterium]
MSRGILGKKLGMTGFFTPEGRYIPATVIEAGPCVVTQIKTKASDGYDALQLGFGVKKTERVNKPQQGHFNKSGERCFEHVREFAVENPADYNLGQELTVEMFKVGERVDVVGKSKGRGFSGVIKRHGFHRGPMTHGSKNIRPPGSIGSSAWPSRVVKGKKLPGQYGNDRKTIRNLEIIDIRSEENLILVKGAVPGAEAGLVAVNKPKFKRD